MANILITGATSGIGQQTAIELARRGHRIGVHGRNAEKARAVVAEITDAGGTAEVFTADLASLEQVCRLSTEVRGRWNRLDVLLNNAGLVNTERLTSQDGHELTWAVNHLAHFLLTLNLREAIADSHGRVVNVASDAHYGCSVPFGDLDAEQRFSGWNRYQASKLMNVLFTKELARRHPEILTVSLHPGFVASGFGMNTGWMAWAMRLTRLVQLSSEDGAKTSVWCAESDTLTSGAYYAKCREKTPSKRARDADAAERLWSASHERVERWL